jgi:hypothetical protein
MEIQLLIKKYPGEQEENNQLIQNRWGVEIYRKLKFFISGLHCSELY